MKKKLVIVAIAAVAIFLVYFIGTGFMKNGSVYINEYAVSEDGSKITLDIGVATSAGYIRDVTVSQQEGGKLYIDCYAAFGGINGCIGAKSRFTLPIEEGTTIIGIYRDKDCYEEVLYKDTDGSWKRHE